MHLLKYIIIKNSKNAQLCWVFTDLVTYSKLYLHSHSLGVAVLKKHYHTLLKSVPEDHMITLGRLSQTTELSDQTVNQVISCSSSEEANQMILDYIIVTIKCDSDLLEFCTTVEKLLENSAVVEPLRAG